MIEAKDVSCTFARNPFSKEGFMAVSPVSIQFIDGERYAIVGEMCIRDRFSKWHIDLQKIRTTLCPEGRVLLIKSKQKIDHIFAEIPRNPTGKIEKPKLRERYGALHLVEAQNKA